MASVQSETKDRHSDASKRLAVFLQHLEGQRFLSQRGDSQPCAFCLMRAWNVNAVSAGGVSVERWGNTGDGGRMGVQPNQEVTRFTLRHAGSGMVASIMTLGAILVDLYVGCSDGQGDGTNVCLGFDALSHYLNGHPTFGAVCGRVAGRIANAELPGGRRLTANHGKHHLHGGQLGFSQVNWQGRVRSDDPWGEPAIELAYLSPAGEEGYPGELCATVIYSLTSEGSLRIKYNASVTGESSPFNPTNHAYFALAGREAARKNDVSEHRLMLAADYFTPTDTDLIPTGEIRRVDAAGAFHDHGELDFRGVPKPLGVALAAFATDKTRRGGLDHYFLAQLPGRSDSHSSYSGTTSLSLVATLEEPSTGRVMECLTSEPGLNVYTGNHLNERHFGYRKHSAVCLETQRPPDAMHHENFPDVMLHPGQKFESITEYRFSQLMHGSVGV